MVDSRSSFLIDLIRKRWDGTLSIAAKPAKFLKIAYISQMKGEFLPFTHFAPFNCSFNILALNHNIDQLDFV